ncbi:glycosyltransferase family 25 protein [Neisseria animaloris]|uniref:Lacto-N-neotetraose biosynthesis glycosyl transferase n=1 Tax=Neisseria animaloris TaxID=326522 RepID=A0A3S4YI87_9NEIS|nr:glycosyltransferase family 25 protein [Neisseria animaloris]VEJ21792.1 lacto-N-neotetraose biosynthesis glycosyl transferase [Neisseria animaloris]
MLHNYVISLKTAESRRKHITQEFGRDNIPFSFFDALTPSPELDEAISKFVPILAHTKKLSSGEKACFMSHLTLWKKCIDDNLPYIGIFEDDILLGKDAQQFIKNEKWLSKNTIVEDAFIIRLETFLMPVNLKKQKKLPPLSKHQFMFLDSTHFGTAGYIISQPAAKILLADFFNLTSEKIDAIDILMFNTFLNHPILSIYQLNPAICIQEQQYNQDNSQLRSQLQEARERNWHNNCELRVKKTFLQRLMRALTKVSRKYKEYRQQIVPFQ